jgi:hypothetical protein
LHLVPKKTAAIAWGLNLAEGEKEKEKKSTLLPSHEDKSSTTMLSTFL